MLNITIDGELHSVPTVQELREMGIRTFVSHLRYDEFDKYDKKAHVFNPSRTKGVRVMSDAGTAYLRPQVEPRGGETRVLLLREDAANGGCGHYAEGRVRCSREDAYVKRVGYVLALERAIDNLHALGYGGPDYTTRRYGDDDSTNGDCA